MIVSEGTEKSIFIQFLWKVETDMIIKVINMSTYTLHKWTCNEMARDWQLIYCFNLLRHLASRVKSFPVACDVNAIGLFQLFHFKVTAQQKMAW